MKAYVRAIPVALFAILPAVATPVPAACGNQKLSDLMSLGATGCFVNDKLFANFGVTDGGPNTNRIDVDTGIDAVFDEVISFSGSGDSGLATVHGGSDGTAMDFVFRYTVQTLQAALIEDVGVEVGALTTRGNGSASASVSTLVCLGSQLTPLTGCTSPAYTLTAGPGGSAHVKFSPVPLVTIFDHVTITAGAHANAGLGYVTNTFSQTPEPGTCAMVVAGAALIAAGYRKKLKA